MAKRLTSGVKLTGRDLETIKHSLIFRLTGESRSLTPEDTAATLEKIEKAASALADWHKPMGDWRTDPKDVLTIDLVTDL